MSNSLERVATRGDRLAALLLLAMVLSAAAGSKAQIVAPSGRTLFNEGLLVRSVLRLDTFEEPSGGGQLTTLRSVNALVWGVRPHTSLSLVVPVVRTERPAAGGGSETSTTGAGDASVFARYDVIRRNVPGGYTRLAPELGLKLPTGGVAGTGSTDLVAGLVFSHVRDPDWWIADVQVTSSGSGNDELRAGQRRRFDLAYLRRVRPRGGLGIPMVLLVLELNGESADETRRSGIAVPTTGGEVLFLSPGVEYIVSRRLVLEASLPIPIAQDLGAARPKPKVSAILGMRWLF